MSGVAGRAAAEAAAAAAQQQQQGAAGEGGFRAPPGTTELPTCPVCLERLDEHISGIVTTVGGWSPVSAAPAGTRRRSWCCSLLARGLRPSLAVPPPSAGRAGRAPGQVCNHRFHNECLRRWGDTSCPVCRYCQHSGATTSHCATCSTSSGGRAPGGRAGGRAGRRWRCAATLRHSGRQEPFARWPYPFTLLHSPPRPAPPRPRPVDLPDLRARGVRALPRLARRRALAVQRARLRAGAGDAGGRAGRTGMRVRAQRHRSVSEATRWSCGRRRAWRGWHGARAGAGIGRAAAAVLCCDRGRATRRPSPPLPAARVGLRQRQLRAPPHPVQDRRQAGGGEGGGGEGMRA